jgi:hypothetical protein
MSESGDPATNTTPIQRTTRPAGGSTGRCWAPGSSPSSRASACSGGLFGATWERRQIDRSLERRSDRRSGRTLCPDTGRGETAGGFQAHDGDAVSDAQASCGNV